MCPWEGFPGGSDGKESTCKAGDLGLIPGLGRFPGGGMATHSSILAWRIPTDRGAWRATVHGIAKIQTWLNDFHIDMSSEEWQVENSTLKCVMVEKRINVALAHIFPYELQGFTEKLCEIHFELFFSPFLWPWLCISFRVLEWIFHQLILKNFKNTGKMWKNSIMNTHISPRFNILLCLLYLYL